MRRSPLSTHASKPVRLHPHTLNPAWETRRVVEAGAAEAAAEEPNRPGTADRSLDGLTPFLCTS